MSLKQQDDVLMYEEVFRLLQEADAAMQPGERRNFMRSEFNGWQMMAPYRNNKPPRQHEFKFVECRDLSSSGFSFMASDFDATEDLVDEFVIALGAAPFKFYVARIVNRRWERKGADRNLVFGCRFVRTLS